MGIYFFQSSGSPRGPQNPLYRIIGAIGGIVMLSLFALVFIPIFGVVVLVIIGVALVLLAIFLLKRWLYNQSTGFSSSNSQEETFHKSRPETAVNPFKSRYFSSRPQVEDAVEVIENNKKNERAN